MIDIHVYIYLTLLVLAIVSYVLGGIIASLAEEFFIGVGLLIIPIVAATALGPVMVSMEKSENQSKIEEVRSRTNPVEQVEVK